MTAAEPLLTPAESATAGGVLPPPVEAAAVRRAVRQEWARQLDDVLLRRTSWGHYYRDRAAVAAQAAAWMAAELGWSEAETAAQVERYLAIAGA